MDINKVMENLEKNGIKPYFVQTREEVVPLVKTLIKKGESVLSLGKEEEEALAIAMAQNVNE